MTGSWLPVAVGGLSAAAAVALAVAKHRRVLSRPSAGAPRLVASLRRAPIEDRLALARASAPPGSWEASLVAQLGAASDGDARALEVDAALAEVDGALIVVRGWSAAGLRVGLLGGLLGAALALLDGRNVAAVLSAVVGGLAAAFAGALGLRSDAHEVTQRRLVDELVGVLVGGRVGAARPGASVRRVPTRPVLDRTDGAG